MNELKNLIVNFQLLITFTKSDFYNLFFTYFYICKSIYCKITLLFLIFLYLKFQIGTLNLNLNNLSWNFSFGFFENNLKKKKNKYRTAFVYIPRYKSCFFYTNVVVTHLYLGKGGGGWRPG